MFKIKLIYTIGLTLFLNLRIVYFKNILIRWFDKEEYSSNQDNYFKAPNVSY